MSSFYESQNPSVIEDSFMNICDELWNREELIYSERYGENIGDVYKIPLNKLKKSIYKDLRKIELEITKNPYYKWLNHGGGKNLKKEIDEKDIRKKREINYQVSTKPFLKTKKQVTFSKNVEFIKNNIDITTNSVDALKLIDLYN